VLVPGLIEWPARIARPRTTSVRATTSDLLPTLCALTGQSLPDRPLDGIDLTPVLEGTMTERPSPLFFWSYNTQRLLRAKTKPWIDPELQKGTTPLVKLQGGKATRDFLNYRQPPIAEEDYLGPRAIIHGRFKLVVHEQGGGAERRELFDLATDPAEKKNLFDEQPKIAGDLQSRLRQWQESVLASLSGGDYK
jgi:arylsulfatase A-like enzyme